jgi:hypothetical protein
MQKKDSTGMGGNPQPFINHPPEVESRREEYERMIQAIHTLYKSHSDHVDSRLDYETEVDGQDSYVVPALLEHLSNVWELVDWYTPEGARLYVEIRLLADAQKFRREDDHTRTRRIK